MAHSERLDVCNEIEKRNNERLDDHEGRISDLEKDMTIVKIGQAEDRKDIQGVCKKMDNLTRAIWGLVSSVLLMLIASVINFILK